MLSIMKPMTAATAAHACPAALASARGAVMGTGVSVARPRTIAPTYPIQLGDPAAVRDQFTGVVVVDGFSGSRSWSPPV